MPIPLSPKGRNTPRRAGASVAVLAFGTMLVGVAIDLVLPAVPTLPAALGGTTATAQLVLAAYVAGNAVGLVLAGRIADHFDRRLIFVASLAAFAAVSLACAAAGDIWMLVTLRLLQGAASSGPGVVAPGMVRSLFDDRRAVRVIGLLGSVQSLVPALAPIAGAWLAGWFGWAAAFLVTGAAAAAFLILLVASPNLLPAGRSAAGPGKETYGRLFVSAGYLRHALSYALSLGGLVTFVFAARVVIVDHMAGAIADFVILQVVGVGTFILVANLSGLIAARLGSELAVRAGTGLMLASGVGILAYGLAGGIEPLWLLLFWVPMNVGMGLRGPPGYVAAIAAAGDNDARAAALVGLFLTAIMASATALVAPFLYRGLVAAGIAMVVILVPAVVVLWLPPASRAALP